jgi:hypothetical protein
MKNRFKYVLVALTVLALTAAFANAEDFTPQTQIRVVHASPDAPAVDLWINGIQIALAAPYKTISPYAKGPANLYNFKVVPAGGTVDQAVIDADLNLFYNKTFTLIALNKVASIEALFLTDDNTNNPNAARVRFVHASPDAPAVDIKVAGGPFLFQDIEFKEVGDYIEVPTVTTDIEVRVAGTDTVALTIPSVALVAGNTYTVFAVGEVGEGTLEALLSVDSEGAETMD